MYSGTRRACVCIYNLQNTNYSSYSLSLAFLISIDLILLRGAVDLESPYARLDGLALHLAVAHVAAGAHRLADHHQVLAPAAQRLESSNTTSRARCEKRRDKNLSLVY